MFKKKLVIGLTSLAVLAVAIAVRCYLVFNCIDHSTGFYLPGCESAAIFDIAAVLIAFLGLIFSFVSPAKPSKNSPPSKQPKPARFVWAFASGLLGAFFLHSYYQFGSGNVEILFLPTGIENESVLFAKLHAMPSLFSYICLISAFVFLVQAVILLEGRHLNFLCSGLFKLLHLFPIIWLIVFILKITAAYTSIVYISEHIMEVLALVFVLKTFFSLAVLTTSNPEGRTVSKADLVCVYLSTLFYLLASVPLSLLRVFNPSLPYFVEPFYYCNFTQAIVALGLYNLVASLCIFPRSQQE